jgi:hypothetical protein
MQKRAPSILWLLLALSVLLLFIRVFAFMRGIALIGLCLAGAAFLVWYMRKEKEEE